MTEAEVVPTCSGVRPQVTAVAPACATTRRYRTDDNTMPSNPSGALDYETAGYRPQSWHLGMMISDEGLPTEIDERYADRLWGPSPFMRHEATDVTTFICDCGVCSKTLAAKWHGYDDINPTGPHRLKAYRSYKPGYIRLLHYYLSYYCHTSIYDACIRSTDNDGGGSLSSLPRKPHDENGTPPSGRFWREGGLHETCDSTPWHISPHPHCHSSQPHDTSHSKHRPLHGTNRRLSTPPTAPPISDTSLTEPLNSTQPPQHPTQHSPRPAAQPHALTTLHWHTESWTARKVVRIFGNQGNGDKAPWWSTCRRHSLHGQSTRMRGARFLSAQVNPHGSQIVARPPAAVPFVSLFLFRARSGVSCNSIPRDCDATGVGHTARHVKQSTDLVSILIFGGRATGYCLCPYTQNTPSALAIITAMIV